MGLLLQTAGSLAAILMLAGLAWWLKLGGAPVLDSDDAVRHAADEVEDGFSPAAITIAHDGASALARDTQGRIMVIRRHGNRFAGRVLGPHAQAHVRHDQAAAVLDIDPGEPRFGRVLCRITDADTWADAINQVNRAKDA